MAVLPLDADGQGAAEADENPGAAGREEAGAWARVVSHARSVGSQGEAAMYVMLSVRDATRGIKTNGTVAHEYIFHPPFAVWLPQVGTPRWH